jgi:hypothetical protein
VYKRQSMHGAKPLPKLFMNWKPKRRRARTGRHET